MSNVPDSVGRFAKLALGISTFLLLGTAAVTIARQEDPAQNAARAQAAVSRVRTGTEIIVFFVASSTCGASQHPTLPASLRQIRQSLWTQAKAEGKRLVYVGVAVDESPMVGLEFLKQFGPFDEVIAGGGWVGTGAVDLMVRGLPGPLALPQLIVIERQLKALQSTVSVSEDRVLLRKLGFDEILRLAETADSAAITR